MRRMIVTNEHGAWVILSVPVLSVILVSGAYTVTALLLLLTALGWFMVYKPAEMLINAWLRGGKKSMMKQHDAFYWLAVYIVIAALLSTALLLLTEAWLLIPAGLILALVFFIMKFFMTSPGYSPLRNFTGTLLLTSGGFLADIALHGAFTQRGLIAAVLNLLFFTISSSFADLKMRELREDEGRVMHARLIIPLFIFIMTGIVYILSHQEYILAYWLLPGLLPLLLHFAADRFGMKEERNFKRLGITLMIYSILFLVTLPYAIR